MFRRPTRPALLLAGLLAGVASIAGAPQASAHGGGIGDSLLAGSTCAQKLDGAEVDLNIFLAGGGQPSCDGVPPGPATLTFDLVDPWLRQVPVGVEVIQTDAGSRGVSSLPARVYPGGVVSLRVRLDRPGTYTAAVVSGGSRATFPIGVGGLFSVASAERFLSTPVGWLSEALLALVVGGLGWLGFRRLRASRRTERARRGAATILADRSGVVARPHQLPSDEASGSTVNGNGAQRKKTLIGP
jgi:hypothetical protein